MYLITLLSFEYLALIYSLFSFLFFLGSCPLFNPQDQVSQNQDALKTARIHLSVLAHTFHFKDTKVELVSLFWICAMAGTIFLQPSVGVLRSACSSLPQQRLLQSSCWRFSQCRRQLSSPSSSLFSAAAGASLRSARMNKYGALGGNCGRLVSFLRSQLTRGCGLWCFLYLAALISECRSIYCGDYEAHVELMQVIPGVRPPRAVSVEEDDELRKTSWEGERWDEGTSNVSVLYLEVIPLTDMEMGLSPLNIFKK